jgi:hypothetical protein
MRGRMRREGAKRRERRDSIRMLLRGEDGASIRRSGFKRGKQTAHIISSFYRF